MSRRTRYNHRDANEAAIVKAIAQLGIEWYEGGPLDGHIWLGQWIPVEIKTAKGKLTPGQKDFISRCNMLERPYRIWRTPLEAIESVREFRGRPYDQQGSQAANSTRQAQSQSIRLGERSADQSGASRIHGEVLPRSEA